MGTLFCTADIHLSKKIRNRKIFNNDSYNAFLEMCNKIIEYPDTEKALIQAGDIFDNNYATGETLEVYADGIDRLYENNIPVYEIMGNHDKGVKSIPVTQGAININEQLQEICGYKVYGLDYRPPDILIEDLKKVPECDLLLLHQAFQHLLQIEGAYDVSVYDIPECVQYTFCGDIHTVDIKELSGNRYFISPGSLHPVKLDEDYKHGFMKFDGKWEFMPVTTRKILRKHLNTTKDVDVFEGELKELQMEPMPIVDIKYEHELYGKIEEIKNEYENKVFFISVPFMEGNDVIIPSQSSLVSTMVDKLEYAVDKNKNRKQYNFCNKLLTKDFEKVISDKVQEIGIELEE